MAVENGSSGEWLGLKAAAGRLGLSEKTVRKRAKNGGYPSRLVTTPFGERYEVLVDSPTTPPDSTPRLTTPPDSTPDVGLLIGLVEQLRADLVASQADVVARAEAAAMWQARAEMLAGQLADLREHVRALEAPREPEVDPGPAPGAEAASEPATRPWWRFWG